MWVLVIFASSRNKLYEILKKQKKILLEIILIDGNKQILKILINIVTFSERIVKSTKVYIYMNNEIFFNILLSLVICGTEWVMKYSSYRSRVWTLKQKHNGGKTNQLISYQIDPKIVDSKSS